MARILFVAALLLITCNAAHAIKAPKLPASAKRLTGAEIVALYDRTKFRFHNYTGKQAITGTFVVNFSTKTASGTFVEGKKKGSWKGTVRIRGNQFCRKIERNREGCVYLYVDGNDIYDVNGKGRVESLNRK